MHMSHGPYHVSLMHYIVHGMGTLSALGRVHTRQPSLQRQHEAVVSQDTDALACSRHHTSPKVAQYANMHMSIDLKQAYLICFANASPCYAGSIS